MTDKKLSPAKQQQVRIKTDQKRYQELADDIKRVVEGKK